MTVNSLIARYDCYCPLTIADDVISGVFLGGEYITSVRFSNAWWEFAFTRLTVCSKTLIFYVLAWRHGYLLPLGAVYHHEQLAADSGGGEQLGVGAFSEVGLVQTLDGGGVAAVIVPPTVLRIRNDGRRVVSAKFPQNHWKIRTNILRHLIFKLHDVKKSYWSSWIRVLNRISKRSLC